MEQLERIEARLHSLAELGQLVGALRSMAAMRSQEALQAAPGADSFRATIMDAVQRIMPLVPETPAPEAEGGAALIVVTSEHGFVGGLNTRLVETAMTAAQPAERIILIGRRGQMTALERGLAVDHAFSMTTHPSGAAALARRVARQLRSRGAVRLLHAVHQPGAAFEPQLRQVLPPVPSGLPGPAGPPPLHHLPAPRLLQRLAAEILFAEIAAALIQSLVAENVQRMRTLDAATHNISDKVEKLTRAAHVARQERITSELLDVATGAEAVLRG